MLSGRRVLILFCLLPGSVFFSSLTCSVVTESKLCSLRLPYSFVGLIQAEGIQLEATVGFKSGGKRIEYFFPSFLPALGLCLWLYFTLYGSCCMTLYENTTSESTWLCWHSVLLCLCSFLCWVCPCPERISFSLITVFLNLATYL